LARALAIPKASYLWPQLVELFKNEKKNPDYGRPLVKEGLAVALSVTVTEKTLNDLIGLVRDERQGATRVFLLSPLIKRAKRPEIAELLVSLKDDPDLKEEVKAWIKRREKRKKRL
jgi:hypothetical protein